jgi:hypothetical protein
LSPIRRIDSAGADEGEAALLDALGEVGVLGQEAVAGVDGLGESVTSAAEMIAGMLR